MELIDVGIKEFWKCVLKLILSEYCKMCMSKIQARNSGKKFQKVQSTQCIYK